MKTSITKRLEFDAAHRLMNHEGKCKNMHGHRWMVEVTISGIGLDGVGRIIDFSEVKKTLGKWIDEHLDHNTILNAEDKEVIAAVSKWCVGGQPYIVPFNPTSENLARHLLEVFGQHLNSTWPDGSVKVLVEKVVLYETPSSFAEVTTQLG